MHYGLNFYSGLRSPGILIQDFRQFVTLFPALGFQHRDRIKSVHMANAQHGNRKTVGWHLAQVADGPEYHVLITIKSLHCFSSKLLGIDHFAQ